MLLAACRLRTPGALLCVAAVLAFGWTEESARRQIASRWPPTADGTDLRLTGWIDEIPSPDAGRTVISLRVTSDDAPVARVRLSWYEPAFPLAAGQALDIVARLRSPRGLSNPGGFDYERWLLLEGYDATGYVRSGQVDESAAAGPARRWLAFRAGLVASIAERIPDADSAALVAALGLGERSGFGDRHWTVLQRTGTSHLVAVSGLHIGLIAGAAYLALLQLVVRLPYRLARQAHAIAAGLCIVPATIYAALAGFALPAQRALLMLLVAQTLILMRRRQVWTDGLGLVLIVILLLDPLATLSASFWLSFGAVALLFSGAGGRSSGTSGSGRRRAALAGFVRVQWRLSLGLAPFVIWFFGQVSLASLVVNLVAIPVFAFVVVPLTLTTVLALAFDLSIPGLFELTAGTAGVAWRALEWAGRADVAAISLPAPSFPALAIGVAAIVAALPEHRLPGRRLALLALLPLVFGRSDRPAPGEARVTVLDVGHGLAVVIATSGHRVLYDAGPRYRSGFDTGEEIVAPAIAALGVAPPDLMIVSHADSDHAGGARALITRYPGMQLLAGPDVGLDSASHCIAGQQWTWDGVSFALLHPPSEFSPRGNESSCVLRVDTRFGSLLLTGDIESGAETLLAESRFAAGLAADVVVVPHHGSLTSSTPSFVARVAPQLAVVSAGFNNRWGFPRPEVRARWEAVGATILVTGARGAVDIRFSAGGLRVSANRETARRYWHAD